MAELWSIAITAAATLVGAFGGAVLSNKHAKDTQAQRLEAEREQWTRDKKLAAYQQFWNSQWDFYHECHRLELGEERVTKLLRMATESRPTMLRMLAPNPVADLAEDIHQRLMWFAGTLYPDTMEQPHIKRALNEYRELVERFEKLMRSDVADSEGNVT